MLKGNNCTDLSLSHTPGSVFFFLLIFDLIFFDKNSDSVTVLYLFHFSLLIPFGGTVVVSAHPCVVLIADIMT